MLGLAPSGARRPDRPAHRWSGHWFSGRSEGSRRTDRQSGRSGIWPRYPSGLGTWVDRIGARKFKLRLKNETIIAPPRFRYHACGRNGDWKEFQPFAEPMERETASKMLCIASC